MNHPSTIRAFQKILTTFSFMKANSFPEDFAIKRFLKKMEIPDDEIATNRRNKCFDDYIAFDMSLRLPRLLPGNWYKARLLIHQWCKNFRLDPLVFTNGSEAHATNGFNSIESKLMRSRWECSSECWDLWADTAHENLCLKRSTRARFSAIMKHDRSAIKAFHKESYKMFKHRKEYKKLCFLRMLSHVTFIRESSRFSTVRKNNEKDRPIDVQPLCNMLVQRRIGNGFRTLLLGECGVDLDSLADSHRLRIKDSSYATIDLKNASDSIHLELVRFLFPKSVFSLIQRSRTFYTEGLDGNFYITNKVSAMGNGFTFELMTVILRAIGLQYDDTFSVFGDDIIVKNEHAPSLISDLESVGFLVNVDKTFINSPFRESCGGNYHDEFGYIESYDFEYPLSIHDCIVINNKAFALSIKYPQFARLSSLLLRAVPHALHGPAFAICDGPNDGRQGYNQDINLSTTFWSKRPGGCPVDNPRVKRALRSLHYKPSEFKLIYGYRWKPEVASPRRNYIKMSRSTGKYFMYLFALRITDDIITGCGSWQKVAYLHNGNVLFRMKSLVSS